ncbi:MATE family efflux transporter [Blautia obeum]|uniref:MATE family efflux transporter n=1 Tax=Blautia obeum TaxID=40520 RepID=UPI003F8BEA52
MSKDEYLITDAPLKALTVFAMPMILVLSIVLGVFGFCFSRSMMSTLQTPADILDDAVLYLRVYFVGFPFLFMYNILSTMFNSIGESKIPLGLLIFSSILNIFMDLWMVAGLDLGVFGAALATLIAQGISAVFSLLIFLSRMRRYKSYFDWFDRQELHSMFQIVVPSVLQQSTVSIGMMIVQAVVNPFGTQALAGYAATMRVENVFSLIFAPRFGIAFVWLAVPAGWFANFLISYVVLRRSWPTEE